MLEHLACSCGLSVNNYFEHWQVSSALVTTFYRIFRYKNRIRREFNYENGYFQYNIKVCISSTLREEYGLLVQGVSFGIRLHGLEYDFSDSLLLTGWLSKISLQGLSFSFVK